MKMNMNSESVHAFAVLLIVFCCVRGALSQNYYSDYGSTPIVQKEKVPDKDKLTSDLQKDMLELFGQKNRPRPDIFSSIGRTTSSAVEYMKTLYKTVNPDNQNAEDPDEQNKEDNGILNTTQEPVTASLINTDPIASESAAKADTIVSFVNHGHLPRVNISNELGAMYFDVSSNLVIEKTLASELRIYVEVKNKKTSDNVFYITAYQILIPRRKYLALSRRTINATESGWHEFDIVSAAKEWRDHPSSNHGLLLTCQSITGRNIGLGGCGIVDFNGENEKRPFLVSFFSSGSENEILAEQIPEMEERKIYIHQRIRRSLSNLFPRASKSAGSYEGKDTFRRKNEDTQHCRRRSLYISFKDLGWSDWIIAPSGFQAEFCKGECTFPLGRNMNASNHAIIQTLVHLMSPKRIPQPCCAPLRLLPLQVLYLDDYNNVVMKKYANMIVKDCGCQ